MLRTKVFLIILFACLLVAVSLLSGIAKDDSGGAALEEITTVIDDDDATELVFPGDSAWVKRVGRWLRLDGKKFRFAGVNNYYLSYKSQFMVDDVLEIAAAKGFTVARTWGFIDIGNEDGSNSIEGKADGVVYYQYWDGVAPAYNDGPDGLQHLDYVIYRAGQLGLKLALPLVNNWSAFGGMDQYVRWNNGQYHDEFYTDPTIRQWYKNWIEHVLNRVNTYTGIAYKDDPTIMMWELANEPRCKGSGAYPTSGNCTPDTIVAWADEMSRHIKRIDPKHLVSVGDEGFYNDPQSADWIENGSEGVDTIALTKLRKVDVMSFHLYPDHWGRTVEWGQDWIQRHLADAWDIKKPAILGEYGLLDKSARNPNYKLWTDTVLESNGTGALVWMLAGLQDDGSLYPDFDGFTIYGDSPVCLMLRNFAQMMKQNRRRYFPPVADNDVAVTPFQTPVLLNPPANDVAYHPASIMPSSIDLDPAMRRQQTVISVNGGTFAASEDGSVMFTPDAGFAGIVQLLYLIRDSLGRPSNEALIEVTVEPDANAALLLTSFETGVEGWGPPNWDLGAGTTSQSADFATHGSYSLKVDANYGQWFGVVYGQALDLTGKTAIKWDIQTTTAGTSQQVAIQLGDAWTWCEAGTFEWVSENTTKEVQVDLTSLSCGLDDLSQVHSLYIFLGNGGTGSIYLDNVRAE